MLFNSEAISDKYVMFKSPEDLLLVDCSKETEDFFCLAHSKQGVRNAQQLLILRMRGEIYAY